MQKIKKNKCQYIRDAISFFNYSKNIRIDLKTTLDPFAMFLKTVTNPIAMILKTLIKPDAMFLKTVIKPVVVFALFVGLCCY